MVEVINQFFRVPDDIMNTLSEEMNDETVKENLMEESKPVSRTVDGLEYTEVIFPRKVKSKFVTTKPALWEQNVQNLKNKNLNNK